MSERASSTRAAKNVAVKNRAPAAIQISAEQLVLEARDRALVQAPAAPARHVADVGELQEHRLRVRKEFEDSLRMHRHNIGTWLRYARWEEGAHEVERARR
jgi:crooked neck